MILLLMAAWGLAAIPSSLANPPGHTGCQLALEASADIDLWIESARPGVRDLFRSRFLRNGAVPAADPGVNPDYAADWLRDSGLAWLTFIDGVRRGEILIAHEELIAAIRSRVKFQRTRLESADAHGSNPSEPRSDLNGTVFTFKGSDGKEYLLPWGRPQGDAPAIAALELDAMAEYLLTHGEEEFVRTELFDNDTYPVPFGVLKRFTQHISNEGISHELGYADLYGAIHNGVLSVEAWEEVFGNHFYTGLMQLDALTRTIHTIRKLSALDKRRNTPASTKRAADLDATARYYASQARKLREVLDQHWIEDSDGSKLVASIREGADAYDRAATLERAQGKVDAAKGLEKEAKATREKATRIEAGIRSDPEKNWPASQRNFIVATLGAKQELTWHFEKMHHRDALVILGIVHTHRKGFPGKWSPTSSKVLATLQALETDARGTFPKSSWFDGVAPVMRYLGDLWQGVRADELPAESRGKVGTYAWTLLTEAFSTIHSYMRNDFQSAGRIRLDADNLGFFRELAPYGVDALRLHAGMALNRFGENSDLFAQVLKGLDRKSDAYLQLVKRAMDRAKAKGITSAEGFDPVSGNPRGAPNLTWNLVEWLRAVWAREDGARP